MKLWRDITREIREKQAVESTRGEHRTAAEHGCRPLSCRLHWQSVVVREERVRVEVFIYDDAIADQLARKASRNSTGRAGAMGGLIKAKVVR